MSEHEWIRTEIRTLEAQIDGKIRALKLGKMLLVLIKKECKDEHTAHLETMKM